MKKKFSNFIQCEGKIKYWSSEDHGPPIKNHWHRPSSPVTNDFFSDQDASMQLYLAYYATFSTEGSRVNSASKTFEDDLKISPNSNCMGVSVKFSKFAWGRSKTMMMRFRDVMIRAIM